MWPYLHSLYLPAAQCANTLYFPVSKKYKETRCWTTLYATPSFWKYFILRLGAVHFKAAICHCDESIHLLELCTLGNYSLLLVFQCVCYSHIHTNKWTCICWIYEQHITRCSLSQTLCQLVLNSKFMDRRDNLKMEPLGITLCTILLQKRVSQIAS